MLEAVASSAVAELLGGLNSWHLTLPIGPSNAATQIDSTDLATYSDPYFKLAPTRDRVQLIDLFGGARTSTGTAYARTELRQEYRGPGALDNDDWPCETTVHALHIEQRIARTPLHKPEMSVGQIHDASNDLLEVRYIGPEDGDGIGTGDGETDTGKMAAHFNDDTSFEELDGAYHLGDTMTVDVSTDGRGNMTVRYQNVTRRTTHSVTAAFYPDVSGGCYFKAGNYHQACSIQDVNGNTNAACKAKEWTSGRYESDPEGQSVLEIFALTVE